MHRFIYSRSLLQSGVGLQCHPLASFPAIKFYCEHKEGKQLGGYVYEEEPGPFRSLWRKPFSERSGFWKSKMDVFASRSFAAGLTRYNTDNFKFLSFRQWWNDHKMEKIIFDQQFIEERLAILGCDLAAAHFVVYRGGAVKFSNHATWIRDDKKNKQEYDEDLPNLYNPDYILEGIDLSRTLIVYEGLKNLEHLKSLKWLSFAQCPFFDNFCLDRLSGEHGEKLEYLDISYTNVTSNGLGALYRFRKLKTLKVTDLSDDPEFLAMCLAIKKCLPELNIEGLSLDTLLDEYETKDVVSKV